ncbi:MAG: hypothetical protein D6729_15635 [Deltaproteobacteria bacterium]|nr:MAG: hypothetical protein D6729_15635 [Deltaproteobacteria bacterium]
MAERWKIYLVEERETLPVRAVRPGPRRRLDPESPRLAARALVDAARRLLRRGPGRAGWMASYADDPVAFLLDTMPSPVRLWHGSGRLLYANPAAAEEEVPAPSAAAVRRACSGSRRFHAFRLGPDAFVLEVVDVFGGQR